MNAVYIWPYKNLIKNCLLADSIVYCLQLIFCMAEVSSYIDTWKMWELRLDTIGWGLTVGLSQFKDHWIGNTSCIATPKMAELAKTVDAMSYNMLSCGQLVSV